MDDDFIDDGPMEQNSVSKYIKEIFGYDKRKYRDEDDDVSNMEANFHDIMKEESRSLRLGMKEDLEDMKDEEARKKRRKQKQLEKLKAERIKKRY
ncbi:protein SPT2 homolog [Lingula anatina]|nr:protein SPT2 homolog [Lingula anatina]|eukprot:XP_013412131.1 protein SPT2 homolog [Lingula anatina]